MKKAIKRILCLVFALSLAVFTLSSCKDKKETSSNNSSTTANTGSDNSTVVPNSPDIPQGSIYDDPNYSPYAKIPESSKGVTVRYATWIDHTATEGAMPLSNFYKDTGIKVELYTVAQSGYVNNLMTKMAAGDIPDVFISNEGDQAFPLTLQIAAPINKVSSVDLNDPRWDQTMLATATIEGNVYLVNTIGSPWSGSNLVYYNKRIFEENGFTSPKDYYDDGTWTWDNMLKCAKEVESLGSDYYGLAIGSTGREMDLLCGAVGTSFVKYNYKTHTFSSGVDDNNLLAAWQWYADAKEQGILDGSMKSFVEGKCGICIRGVYGLKNTGYFMNMNPDDVGFTYLPSFEEGEKGLVSSIYGMHGIIDGAPNADAAGYFIRYWLDPTNYDLDNTFLTIDAGNFYYELINTVADQKYFTFDYPCANLIGESSAASAFYKPLVNSSSAGMKTAIDSVSNIVDKAVEESNKLIREKIEADR